MDKRIISLSFAIIGAFLLICALIYSVKNIKIDDFHPAGVIFLIDASGSNQGNIAKQKAYIRDLCNKLDPEDSVKVVRVSQDAYLIYEGYVNTKSIMKSLNSFTKYEEKDYGTAYGEAFTKALSYAYEFERRNYIPIIITLGDLENEGKTVKQLNWNQLPKIVNSAKKKAPDIALAFLFAHPQKLDIIKTSLTPILGEEKLILSPEENLDRSISKILHSIGR